MKSLSVLLENFKSHIKGQNKTIEGNDENGSWGKIPYDIIINFEKYPLLEPIKKNIPLSIGYDEEGNEIAIIRYKTLIKVNKFVNDFKNSLVYYSFCNRGWIKIGTEIEKKFFDNRFNFIKYFGTSLDSLEGEFEIGEVAAISDMVGEMYRIFRIDVGDEVTTLIHRINVFNSGNDNSLYNGVINGKMEDNEYSWPYADINVFIDADIANVGTFLPLVEEWKPKRFYVGQIVIYEGELYRLRDSKDLNEEISTSSILTPNKILQYN